MTQREKTKSRQKQREEFLLEIINRKLPLYQICDLANSTPQAIMTMIKKRNINYPEELMITRTVYNLSQCYEEGMTVKELAQASKMSYDSVMQRKDELTRIGIHLVQRKYETKNFRKPSEDIYEYGKIIDGIYAGLGCVIKDITDVLECIVYIDKKPVSVKKEMWQVKFVNW